MKRLIILLPLLLLVVLISACSALRFSDATSNKTVGNVAKTTPAPTPEPPSEDDGSADDSSDDTGAAACPVGPDPNELIEDSVEPIANGSDAGSVGTTSPIPTSLTPDKIPFPDPNQWPLVKLTAKQIAVALDNDPASLGSMSIGYPNSGALFNSVPLPEDSRWTIVNKLETWGTQETVGFIMATINKVHKQFPTGTMPIYVGDISERNGGKLNRHLSHQSGRDVDLSWYYKASANCSWWAVGTKENMDLPRTWALIRAFFTETDVELILIDKKIQIILYDYAISTGEDRSWLNRVFQYPGKNSGAIIRHAKGHATHVHVRFYNRNAQEMGRLAYKIMIKRKLIKPPTYYVYHKVRKGQTLGHMARKYNTSVKAIMNANGLKTSRIRAGRSYRIPRRGGVKPAPNPANIPARRIPPPLPGEIVVVKMETPTSVSVNPVDSAGTSTKVMPPPIPAVPAPVIAPAATPRPKPKVASVKTMTGKRWITYKVKSGDNLWSIARRYNTHVKDIKRWNKLKSNNLKPGQKLRMYVKR